jgi:hypothetical protein
MAIAMAAKSVVSRGLRILCVRQYDSHECYVVSNIAR